MNDCIWAFISGVCDCEKCGNCEEYISVNSEDGSKLLEKYEAEVNEALKPLAEKWKKLKEQNKCMDL